MTHPTGPLPRMSYSQAVEVARSLNEHKGDNPEYERGQVELISNLWGYRGVDGDERKEQVEADIFPERERYSILGFDDRIEQVRDLTGLSLAGLVDAKTGDVFAYVTAAQARDICAELNLANDGWEQS